MLKYPHLVEIIQHRINDFSSLEKLSPAHGAEIDIRSDAGRLILAHEPFVSGVSLDDYLGRFAQAHSKNTLIVNTKEDGLEEAVLEKLRAHRIERFFFLDLTLPTLVRMAFKKKEKRMAVRVSEYETEESAQRFAGAVEWVWLDCFSGNPPSSDAIARLHRSFKVCLVSPELQGFPAETIAAFASLKSDLDAVCTKFPAKWS
jgi:hypothetical protein